MANRIIRVRNHLGTLNFNIYEKGDQITYTSTADPMRPIQWPKDISIESYLASIRLSSGTTYTITEVDDAVG